MFTSPGSEQQQQQQQCPAPLFQMYPGHSALNDQSSEKSQVYILRRAAFTWRPLSAVSNACTQAKEHWTSYLGLAQWFFSSKACFEADHFLNEMYILAEAPPPKKTVCFIKNDFLQQPLCNVKSESTLTDWMERTNQAKQSLAENIMDFCR